MEIYSTNKILTTEYIEEKAWQYQRNIILLTILICVFVSVGFLFIYQKLIGRYLDRITELNREHNTNTALEIYHNIPNDEIGAMITSRIKMLHTIEEQLNENKKLIRILVHDLNNSLTVILTGLKLLSKPLPELENSFIERMLVKINVAANSQKSLIDKIRTLEALKSQKKEISLTPTNFEDILNDSRTMFEDRLSEKGVKLTYENKDQEKFQVKVDRVLFFNNVLNNLISNSIKFSLDDGLINIETFTNSDGHKVITYRDNGIGIPQDILEKLFDPDAKTTRAGTKGESGTGFGMPLSRQTVVSFGGTINVESKTVEDSPSDHGSIFTITLKG